jgi:hypothetical protein
VKRYDERAKTVAVGTATPVGGVFYNTKYYQNPVRTNYDPCPAGFRVPTQDEWEQLGAYDCRPDQAGGGFTTNNVSGTPSCLHLFYRQMRSFYRLVNKQYFFRFRHIRD